MKQFKFSIVALSMLLALSGCGGSSSDDPDPQDVPVQISNTTAELSGSVIKGTFGQAQITVVAMNGTSMAMEQEVMTDQSGQAFVAMTGKPGFGIDTVVKVMANADANSTMVCDAVACGSTSLGGTVSGNAIAGTKLTTLSYLSVPFGSGADNSADATFQASALTTLATAIIEQSIADGANVSTQQLLELAQGQSSTLLLRALGYDNSSANIFSQPIVSAESYSNFVAETNCEQVPVVDDNGDPVIGDDGNPVTEEECTDVLIDDVSLKLSLLNSTFAAFAEGFTQQASLSIAQGNLMAAIARNPDALVAFRQPLYDALLANPVIEELGLVADDIIDLELPLFIDLSSSGPVQEVTNSDNLASATITARNRISEGEAEGKAFDNDPQTKWLDHNDWQGPPTAENPSWIQIQFEQPHAVNSLYITSANDAPGRDPENFDLLASNDGETWVTLASFVGESFDERFQRKQFGFANGLKYSHYRLNITKNKGDDDLMQLSEIQLVGPVYPSVDHTDPVGTGTITARNRISDGEAETMAFDNNPETKWLDHNDWQGAPTEEDPSWVQIDLTTPVAVDVLGLTSANDAPGRDPENFRISGSNDDGVTWVVLNSWLGESFDERFERKLFNFDNVLAFSSYRIEITKNKGDDGLMQVAEIELIGPELPGLNHGMAEGTVITARNRISDGEAETMAFDGDVNTKWLDHNDWQGAPTVEDPSWVEVELPKAATVNKLALTSANDAPGRDPENFSLLASNDGQNWLTLNTWLGESFDERFQRKQFSFSNDLGYSHYRLNISKNKGDDGLMQVAEIELLGPQYISEDLSSITGVSITARNRISDAEAESMAFDDDAATKWLDHNNWQGAPTEEDPSWVQVDLPQARIVSSIAITSANDAPSRDPENFTLQGSNDGGATWQTVSSWVGESWDNRFERKLFEMGNGFAYSSYRLNITKNKGDDGLMQLAEIELIGPCLQAGESVSHGLAVCQADAGTVVEGIDGSAQKKTAYVEVNEHDLGNVGCFMEDEQPLFDTAVIFAGNINFDEQTQSPIVHLNENVSALLDDNIQKVRALQDKGIKVVLDILGNHQNAGWACFADEQEAGEFADLVKQTVDKYGLDGVDIDDEYSTCATHDDSLIKVSKAIKDRMPDKLLTKALFADNNYFNASWNNLTLGEQLDYGWEMSYWSNSCTARLDQYVNAGVNTDKLGVGASTVITSANNAKGLAQCAIDNNFNGGMMIFNVTKNSLSYLQKIWQGVTAEASCLK